ncbi:hypothetical protein L249_8167 [Ophiocordyceps polyrhachis-furcata BCC 54312]|uniref:Uncharacterized protein n=1 Tax=Ophiocordyceps polyrhachis-furcata BCC 54312 TaxID=1330021 RepID=A0A367LHM1_9HYPO|nr:hypothetical protein L249_8167 [Ophiocordyceps polyrhachis-furcata BCC 54312]
MEVSTRKERSSPAPFPSPAAPTEYRRDCLQLQTLLLGLHYEMERVNISTANTAAFLGLSVHVGQLRPPRPEPTPVAKNFFEYDVWSTTSVAVFAIVVVGHAGEKAGERGVRASQERKGG